MRRFFITGLPRSRTAWMAAFMSTGNAICLHEPRKWRDFWESESDQFVGISDSGLGFQLGKIIEEYQPQVLIVDRPIDEVEKSLESLNTGLPRTNFCEILKDSLKDFSTGKDNVLRVPFHMLNDPRMMQKIFFHLVPGESFDEGRFLKMRKENIQCDIQALIKNPPTHYVMPPIRIMQ